MLWVIFACLTGSVLLALLRPLFVREEGGAAVAAANAQVYRDQLKEIESDRERGLIAEGEAEAARLEVQRRLLSTDADEPAAMASRSRRPWALAAAVGLLFSITVFALYVTYGSPGKPDQPLFARLQDPPDQRNVGELIARVEARLRQDPEDGRGWDVIAPVYMGVGRFEEAAKAYERSIALLGETPDRLAGFGEALVVAASGRVSQAARDALEKAQRLDPKAVKPSVLLAYGDEQGGDFQSALRRWEALQALVKGDARWESVVAQKIAGAKAQMEGRPAPQLALPETGTGPGPADLDAAAGMTPEARQAMVEQMVGRLASRLDEQGGDLDAWQQLIRAYVVLDRKDDAQQAIAKARTQFRGNASALEQLDALAREVGLKS